MAFSLNDKSIYSLIEACFQNNSLNLKLTIYVENNYLPPAVKLNQVKVKLNVLLFK
jgi:hypothetical protein